MVRARDFLYALEAGPPATFLRHACHMLNGAIELYKREELYPCFTTVCLDQHYPPATFLIARFRM